RRTFRMQRFKQQIRMQSARVNCSAARPACRTPLAPHADCVACNPVLYLWFGPIAAERRHEPRQANVKERPMGAVIEREAASEAMEATVNYILNNGQKLFTETAGPGGTDVRTGGTVDPRRVTIHNARVHAEPFALDREGFRFVRHDTKVADFFSEDE